MQDINSLVFTGRLTADPELRSTGGGRFVARLRIAIRRPGGKGPDRGSAFCDVEVWDGLAQSCGRFLSKGRRVGVEGRLEHQEWTDGNNHQRQRNYVLASYVSFLDPAPQAGEGAQEGSVISLGQRSPTLP